MIQMIISTVANKLISVPMIAGLLYTAKCAYDNDLIKRGVEKERRAIIERIKEKRAERKETADEMKEEDDERIEEVKKKNGMEIIKRAQDVGTK